MYAKVENNAVVKTMSRLPKQHKLADGKTTGNFDKMPSSVHLKEGFCPVEEKKPKYDAAIQTINLKTEVVGKDKVTRQYEAKDIPIAELKKAKLYELEDAFITALANETPPLTNIDQLQAEKTLRKKRSEVMRLTDAKKVVDYNVNEGW
ncbi:hypothetical protein [uncultured Paraglaciecola sp.]|uniref:hypothetical protein n=1 Tax=uncultured Paraglaciecola sp. TaxID=1765024 RepID=UPI00261AC2FA|nr:hypothetical protein [uncultured Paraglaciecola sp.]